MGCSGSKLDQLQPVALCRDRYQHLADAIRHRYALAEAHRAYVGSLRSVGASLQSFFAAADGGVVLELPQSRKGDTFPPPSPVSRCGSHLHICSEDGDSESEDGFLHPHGDSFFHYARRGAPESVVGIERVPFGGYVQVGSFPGDSGVPSSSSGDSYGYYYGDGYSRGNEGYPFGFAHSYASGYAGTSNGFFGGQDLSSHRPPPPPSPPKTSAWDFLNPFGNFESYRWSSTASRCSREVREDEGIPDLEYDDREEVVKKAYATANGGGIQLHGKNPSLVDDGRSNGLQDHMGRRSVNDCANSPVDKNVVSNGASGNDSAGSMSAPVVLEEIKAQFDKASMSCEEISKMLEVGKIPYHQGKYDVVSSKMVHAVAISDRSSSRNSESYDKDISSVWKSEEEEKCMKSGNLSATLQKLYIWEKKLHEEVRAEEKLRMLLDKKCKQLKHLDDTGTEAQKLDAVRGVIKKLSTKIKIAIQVIGSISVRISRLRDEELCPQLNELSQGLFKMWQAILSCHGNQFRAIVEAQPLDTGLNGSSAKLNDAHMEATMQLAMVLLSWIQSFYCWIDSTKNYVKALNCWLKKGLSYEPEVTPDGTVPFSPKRLGVPPIFALCNSWSHALDTISEREVVGAMLDFTNGVLHVWQQHYNERRKRFLTDNNDMERMLKALDSEDQKIHKAVDALKKRCSQLPSQSDLLRTGEIIHLSYMGEPRNLHLGLKRIFEVMERFASSSVEAYMEL